MTGGSDQDDGSNVCLDSGADVGLLTEVGYLPSSQFGVTELDSTIIGTPDNDAMYWQVQTTEFTCGIVALLSIINEYTGQHNSEAQLVYEATVNHMLSDTSGMNFEDLGNLLEMHSIASHTVRSADISDLLAELSAGHKVIVGVHAEDLWESDNPLYAFTQQAANHAIWVTGVDMTDPNCVRVIINDSGDPLGREATYDVDTFLQAWSASGFAYVATDLPPAGLGERCVDFDEQSGTFSNLVDYIRERHPDFEVGCMRERHPNFDRVLAQVVNDPSSTAAHPGMHRRHAAHGAHLPPTITELAPEQRIHIIENL